MKRTLFIAALLVSAAAGAASAQSTTFVLTSSNNPSDNQLLVYDATGTQIQALPTNGLGGVSGNAGGIAATRDSIAVVNFGSQSVSVFDVTDAGVTFRQLISTLSPPVSVAFGKDHLYVLGTTLVESHRITGRDVDAVADGSAPLLVADGSAAQVGVLADELLISEKSNAVEVVTLAGGVVAGPATRVAIPAGSDTPLGLVTRGANGYVTIAHSDEVGLVKNDELIALTSSGTQHAPCWLALVGAYLYSSNSPSHSISRYVVTGTAVVLDAPIAAMTAGAPTDIASSGHIVAVIDGGAETHLTQFYVDDAGDLQQRAVSTVNKGANGVAVIER
jgi:hypothetical protein